MIIQVLAACVVAVTGKAYTPVTIAAGPVKEMAYLGDLLRSQDIPLCPSGGSITYGLEVPRKFKERALRTLLGDVKGNDLLQRYGIAWRFEPPSRRVEKLIGMIQGLHPEAAPERTKAAIQSLRQYGNSELLEAFERILSWGRDGSRRWSAYRDAVYLGQVNQIPPEVRETVNDLDRLNWLCSVLFTSNDEPTWPLNVADDMYPDPISRLEELLMKGKRRQGPRP